MTTETIPFANHPREIERQIIVLLVRDILKGGFRISVYNGEEYTIRGSTNEAEIFAAMSTTDDERLTLNTPIGSHAGRDYPTLR